MRVFLIFTAVAVGTYLIRLSGIALLSNPERIPPRVQRALGLVAPTAMGAIIVNSLFLDEGGWREFGAWHLAAAVAIAVALWRRSSGWAMSLGAAAFALLLVAGL
jgi:branched-subunit amino acid transport protein